MTSIRSTSFRRLATWWRATREPYRYLVESIRRFPTPAQFSQHITEAGFGRVTHRTMAGGVVALHSAWKL